MENLLDIDPVDFVAKPFHCWDKGWFLLGVGDRSLGKCNIMTVGWGFFGTMWGKPVAVAAVRPQRFSAPLLTEFDTFTLCALPEERREALTWCGRHSGAEGDKFAGAGLTACDALKVAAPAVEEAELVIECRKLYQDRFYGKNFCDKSVSRQSYPDGDYHLLAYGEIVALRGTEKYC